MATSLITKYARKYTIQDGPLATPCWVWKSKNRPMLSCNGIKSSAARWFLRERTGYAPSGLCVLHKCDDELCVNPDHLYLGTPADNGRDITRRLRAKNAQDFQPMKSLERPSSGGWTGQVCK